MFVSSAPSNAEVADRAAVDAAARRLQLGDDLHRPHLRRAGDRAAGKGGAQQVERVRARAQVARRPWRPGGARWRSARARTAPGHATRAGAADARQVVAHQVHDHHVLGAVLRALGQRLPERRVVLGADSRAARVPLIGRVSTCSPRPRAGTARARRSRPRRPEVEEGGERRRVARAQPAVERPRRLGAAAPRSAATGWPGRCRRRGCTRARAPPRRGRRRRVNDERSRDAGPTSRPRRERGRRSPDRDGGLGRTVERAAASSAVGHASSRPCTMRGPRLGARARGAGSGVSRACPVEISHARDASWSHASTQS